VAPRLDPALAKWLWKFSRTCTERHVDAAVRTLAPLGWVSRRLFDELLATERLECGFRGEGYYEICLTEGGSGQRGRKLHSSRALAFIRNCYPAGLYANASQQSTSV
jgi:hypothetical protein